ncbi:MAG: hypothetical protein J6B41_04765 [Alistipes sp.]|nr:hypothetical protein [Alistipes sp.]
MEQSSEVGGSRETPAYFRFICSSKLLSAVAMWQSCLRVLGNVVLLRNYQTCDCKSIVSKLP